MDWAEALAGFSDAESEALGEPIYIGDLLTTAVVGSVTETLEIEAGGYLRNESVTATTKSLSGLELETKPRVNELVELRGKVWRIHEVASAEMDTSIELTLEYVPDIQPKYSLPYKEETPSGIQAEKPSNVTAGLYPVAPANIEVNTAPIAPSLPSASSVAPDAPSNIISSSSPTLPFNVKAETTPQAPSLPDATLPQIDIYLVAGQSNAHGHSSTADLTATQQEEIQDFNFYTSWHANTSQASTQQYYGVVTDSMEAGKTRGQGSSSTLSDSGQFGIEWGFAKKAKEINLASGNIGIIKYAIGASTIQPSSFSHWDINTTGEAWDGFKNAIADGIQKYNQAGYNVNIKGLVWYQGESNGGNDADTYLGYFEPFLQALETELGVTNLPAVFCAPADQAGLDMPVDEAFNKLARQYNYYDFIKISQYHDGSYNNVHLNGSNMYDAGEAVAPAMALAIAGNAPTSSEFSPSTLTTRTWLDMADTSTLTETGGNVTTIGDKSGNSYNFTQASTATITAVSSGLNGRNILRFDNNADFTNAKNIAFDSTAVHKWFLVMKATGADSHDAYLTYQKSGQQIILFNLSGAGRFEAEWYMNPASSMVGNTTNYLNTWVILSAEFNIPNSTASAWVNGTASDTNKAQAGLNLSAGNVRINKYANIGGADWAELIFTENITQAQSDSIEGYLANKWGLKSSLPSTHPYKHYTP